MSKVVKWLIVLATASILEVAIGYGKLGAIGTLAIYGPAYWIATKWTADPPEHTASHADEIKKEREVAALAKSNNASSLDQPTSDAMARLHSYSADDLRKRK